MRTSKRFGTRWGPTLGMLALLALASGSALADAPATTAYVLSSHPMIAGTVVTVNDRQMVVDTDQGEQVALEVDSRTMAPRDLAPGMVLRVEFRALEDCRFYAQRVTAMRDGMPTERLQAYANTRDGALWMPRADAAVGGDRGDGPDGRVAEERESLLHPTGAPSPGTVMTAIPATADYQFGTRPMVSGRVVTVNDHLLEVETDQGRQVGLVMDSRTMVPGKVSPGTFMRAEFMRMGDGRYYAKWIRPIDRSVADREQAYAHTRDGDAAFAERSSDCGFVSTADTHTSAVTPREVRVTPAAVAMQTTPVAVPQRPELLPQTAGDQSLILVLGLLALGGAGLVTVVRGWRGV